MYIFIYCNTSDFWPFRNSFTLLTKAKMHATVSEGHWLEKQTKHYAKLFLVLLCVLCWEHPSLKEEIRVRTNVVRESKTS